jgi:hypothetical protein
MGRCERTGKFLWRELMSVPGRVGQNRRFGLAATNKGTRCAEHETLITHFLEFYGCLAV